MSEDQGLIFAHIMIAASIIMPAVIMKAVDLDQPNKYMGYRTPWSLKSAATWKYANKRSTDLMLWSSLVTLTIQLTSYFIFDALTSIIIATSALVVGLIVVFVLTELELRKKFTAEGKFKRELDAYD